MKWGLWIGVLHLTLAEPVQAGSRPGCDDDPVPAGGELRRIAYALNCGYLPSKYRTYYTTVFDPITQKLVKPANVARYPIFAKKVGQLWTVWQPEAEETGYPDTCTKPQAVEWVASCVKP